MPIVFWRRCSALPTGPSPYSNCPELDCRDDAEAARRGLLSDREYEAKYAGLAHRYFLRESFSSAAPPARLRRRDVRPVDRRLRPEPLPLQLPAAENQPGMRPERDITFFHTDNVELQTTRPIATEAERRGYRVAFSERIDAAAEIGFYCSHGPSPRQSRFSAIMLHDLAQRHDVWPNYWLTEPWHEFDVGFLPGPSWGERWFRSSAQPQSRPRRGMFQLGWPKADSLFSRGDEFGRGADDLRRHLGLRQELSILYAPSWENHGKQDDFVRALRDLPVNLLLKQAPWSDNYPQVLASIAEMKPDPPRRRP
jgi:hypothetical protein